MGDRESGLEKALGRLKLSPTEKKGIRIGKQLQHETEEDDWHAVGKVMADHPISADAIQRMLGWIWSVDRGMVCKEAVDNKFLFSFPSPSALRRSLDDGPWMAGHNLIVVVPYDRMKDLDELEFRYIPIWIRVSKLPMGMMNRPVAEIIGDEVGRFVDVDVEENGTAAGHFLRIKVRIDINKPLMRGVTIDIEDGGDHSRWCPFEYEFLPEFCYCCRIIGHTDKNCNKPVPISERQFGKWLRVIPPRRRSAEEGKGRGAQALNRSNGDWRKDKAERLRENGREDRISEGSNRRGGEEEKSGLIKDLGEREKRKHNQPCVEGGRKEGSSDLEAQEQGENNKLVPLEEPDDVHDTVNASCIAHADVDDTKQSVSSVQAKKMGTYKKLKRKAEGVGSVVQHIAGTKRSAKEIGESSDEGAKKIKCMDVVMGEGGDTDAVEESATNSMAGLSEQPCGSQ